MAGALRTRLNVITDLIGDSISIKLTIFAQNNDYENNTNWETNDAEWDWFDFGDDNEITSSRKPEYIYNEKTGEFNYKNTEFQQKAEARRKHKL